MRLATLSAALLAAGIVAPAAAASADAALLEKLQARLDKLEARNADLEKEVKALKGENEKITKGLESERISQYEPELTARLKAVEKDALDMKKAASKIDALDGLTAGATLTTVAQKANGLPAGTQGGKSQLNYRADITAELPLAPIGDIQHKVFGHFRIGQGLGLNDAFGNLGAFGAPNAAAFRASGSQPDDSVAILGQAWYQATIPLPFGGFRPHSRESLELTFGKMDIFGFFDQNAAAGDESVQFLNSVFVHNPLLDAGGQVGVDANGFQPGFIAAYNNETNGAEPWRISLGVFGTGSDPATNRQGANYQRSFTSPLVMAQAEKQMKFFGGLAGNYRLYAWRQGQGEHLDGSVEKQAGWGLSADQKLGDGITVFGRYGQMTEGSVPFDRALTLGAEFNGSYWSRGGDTLGVALGWMRSSKEFRNAGGTHCLNDDDGDGACTAGDVSSWAYVPSGAEQVAEIYYRYRINPNLELSPDLQYVRRMGADPAAKNATVLGLRANVTF